MRSLPSLDALAATYNTPAYADPMDAIADFETYRREWASSELGSAAVASRMELPRGRIRSWQDGSKPDVVRGIEVARDHGWIDCEVDSDKFAALNRLVAGVFSGGSISDSTFAPSFSAPDSYVEDQLRDDLESLGAGCQWVMSNSGNVEELRPESNASVLGRVLVALGAPQGPKAETVDRLPSYLDSVPDELRHSFVRVYVANRGVDVEGKPFVQIMEQRTDRYLDSLAALLRSVTDVDVWRAKKAVRFHDDALSTLGLD